MNPRLEVIFREEARRALEPEPMTVQRLIEAIGAFPATATPQEAFLLAEYLRALVGAIPAVPESEGAPGATIPALAPEPPAPATPASVVPLRRTAAPFRVPYPAPVPRPSPAPAEAPEPIADDIEDFTDPATAAL